MIGGASKKISTIVELAEELYDRTTEMRKTLQETGETLDDTAERVKRLEAELGEQRALLEAIAEAQGVDVEAVESGDLD